MRRPPYDLRGPICPPLSMKDRTPMHHVALAPLMEAIGPLDEDILAVTALDTGWVVRLPDLDL